MSVRLIHRSFSTTNLIVVIVVGLLAQQLIKFSLAQEIAFEEGVTYGKVGEVDLQLDIAYPKEGTGPYPAIVFIHGGAWAGGTRKDYRGSIENAARRGYVGAAISYRLTQFDPATKIAKFPFPAQIQDCKCAVRWLRSVAEKYHIDQEKIGVTGGSAGGHLSLLVGMATSENQFDGDGGHAEQSSRVNAVVNYCGPTELVAEYNDIVPVRDFLIALCKGTPEAAADMYKLASPLTYVSKDNPPILTFHGDADDIVPVNQAKVLDEAMKKVGGQHEMIIFSGVGHAINGESGRQAGQAMWKFFDKHLKGK